MTCFRALDFLSQAEQFLKPKTHFPEFCHVGIPQIIDDYKARLIIRFQKLDFIHLRSHMSRDHQNLDVYNFNGVFTSAVVCSPSIFSKELNHCLQTLSRAKAEIFQVSHFPLNSRGAEWSSNFLLLPGSASDLFEIYFSHNRRESSGGSLTK